MSATQKQAEAERRVAEIIDKHKDSLDRFLDDEVNSEDLEVTKAFICFHLAILFFVRAQVEP
jgi:hypothetical protein